ncbi:YrhB domain-containing protein [Streptomyces sp. NPDC047853]|uniref:YrhB domain-containing protein n=1 Tax=unclassified Streptomyces TaxID=2593676 RepID=UPI0034527E04
MIDRELAVRAAQEDLDRRYSGQLVVSGTEEHELVWIVYYQSAEYLRTGDLSHMLGGNGPYLVDLVDGGLHQIGPVSYVTGAWEVDYRSRIRKMVTRTAVDELHDEIRQTAVARRSHRIRDCPADRTRTISTCGRCHQGPRPSS